MSSPSLADVWRLLEELESALDVAQSDIFEDGTFEDGTHNHWLKTNVALAPVRELASTLQDRTR